MRIKTKRGPRRIRNQRVINRNFIVTDYDGCGYTTPFKAYKIIRADSFGYNDVLSDLDAADFDGAMICTPVGKPCCHLNNIGTWRYLTK